MNNLFCRHKVEGSREIPMTFMYLSFLSLLLSLVISTLFKHWILFELCNMLLVFSVLLFVSLFPVLPSLPPLSEGEILCASTFLHLSSSQMFLPISDIRL